MTISTPGQNRGSRFFAFVVQIAGAFSGAVSCSPASYRRGYRGPEAAIGRRGAYVSDAGNLRGRSAGGLARKAIVAALRGAQEPKTFPTLH